MVTLAIVRCTALMNAQCDACAAASGFSALAGDSGLSGPVIKGAAARCGRQWRAIDPCAMALGRMLRRKAKNDMLRPKWGG